MEGLKRPAAFQHSHFVKISAIFRETTPGGSQPGPIIAWEDLVAQNAMVHFLEVRIDWFLSTLRLLRQNSWIFLDTLDSKWLWTQVLSKTGNSSEKVS